MKNFLFYFFICCGITMTYAQETLEISVSDDNDDVEVEDDGGFSRGSGDLELHGYDGEPQAVYIRFRGITLPSDAEITSAYIEFVGDETENGESSINIYGEVGNCKEYTSASDVNSRNYTTSFVTWITNGSRSDEIYRTPNISSLITGMFSGKLTNADLGFKFDGNGEGGITVESYDGSSSEAPKLIINYNTDQRKVTKLITSGSNDAEENLATGAVSLGNSTLEIGRNMSRKTALRFENITIPSDAQIQDAYIEFYSYGSSNNNAEIIIKNELGNASVYNNATKNISNRNYTTRRVQWTSTAWTSSNTKYRTSNLKEIIDENRLSGWTPGQTLAFMLEGDGEVRAWSRNGSERYQPKLVIEYLDNGKGPSVNPAPIDETIRTYVGNFNNDAEEYLTTGLVTLGDGVLEIGGKNGSTPQISALRFENIDIPSDAQIEDAYIEFYSYGTSSDNTEIIFRTELGNASIYTNSRNNITNRNYSLRKVKWNIDSWPNSNTRYRSPNLKEIIDENRLEGWKTGESLSFKLEGNEGNVRAWSRNGSEGYQPRLVVKYLNNKQGPSVGPVPLDETIRTYVSHFNNDAEEYLATGSVSLGDGVLEIGGKNGSRPQVSALRFENIIIPSDVEITKAYIEFYSYGSNDNPAEIVIKSELGNASIFENNINNITLRNVTKRQTKWTTKSWRGNTRYVTPDLKEIIDENRLSGWKSGNALAFILEGDENTEARVWSRNGSEGYQPRLVIEYVKNGRGPNVGDIPEEGDSKVYISQYNNDAEEYLSTGAIVLGEAALEIGGVNGSTPQITGLRFANVRIPENAEIEDAYIEFYSYSYDRNGDNDMTILLRSELGNASIYKNELRNLSSRSYSLRRIKWDVEPWTDGNVKHRTPNLKEIIDENRILGWESGQAFAFRLEGFGDAGTLRAWSRNGSERYQPRLIIKYKNNDKGPNIGFIPYDSVTRTIQYNNDAEEYLTTGAVALGDGVLNIGGREGDRLQMSALRFENVEIPADLEITDAYIEFYSYYTSNNNVKVTIRSEKVDSSFIYENENRNISGRTYTERRIEWDAGPWSENNIKYRTANLKEIIDENRLSGWETGNPLSFMFEGEGEIRAWARNGSEQYQPKLIIEGIKSGEGPSVSEKPLEEIVRTYVMNYDNDAEEYLTTNSIALRDGALELGGKNGNRPQVSAVRFEGVKIPDDVEIKDAYIEFYSYGSSSRNAEMLIKSELGNSVIYKNENQNITGRNYTKRRVKWTTEAWTRSNTKHRTPNLKEIIDENRLDGWKSDDPLSFKFEGDNGDARAWARDASERYQPRLIIEYLRNGNGPSVGEIPLDETIRVYTGDFNNDVEEHLTTGAMRLSDGTLEIGGEDIGGEAQATGIRFEDVRVPKDAEITDAYIEFYSYGSDGREAEITISSELENSEAYSSKNQNLTGRIYTNITSSWNVERWNSSNTKHRTPNLKNIIDENRLSGWESGQSLAFKLEGNGQRVRAWSRNGSEDYQPRLVIEYLNNGKGPEIEGVEMDASKMDKIYINEVASSGTVKEGSDWIELYNDHEFPVYIEKNVYLSDKESDKKLHKLKKIYIPAKGFTVLYADGSPEEGNKHLDFKLSSKGENIYLSRKINDEISVQDSVVYPEFDYDQSYGRDTDGLGKWITFIEPTFNKTNVNSSRKVNLEFSKKRGVYPSEFTVTLSSTDGATIKYTTDGSYPSETRGTTYNGNPIRIEENTVLKAYAYTSNGYSEMISHSYFLENNLSEEAGWQYKSNLTDAEYAEALNELPIVSISGNSVSFNRNYRETSFEFIDNQLDEDNETFFSNSGTKKFGAWSYGLSSGNYKSKFNKDYGAEKASYNFFDEVKNDAFPPEDVSRMELKEGEDGPQVNVFGLGYARLSEKLIMNTFKEMDTYALSTRLVHLYLNGRYYGVRTMREDFHPNNMEEYFGGDDDDYTEVNLKDGYWSSGTVESGDGSREKWNEVRDYIRNKDFQKIKELVDVDGYIKQLMMYVLMDMENEANAIGHNDAPNYTKFRFLLNDTDGALWNQTGVNCGNYERKWNSAGCSINGPGGLSGAFIGTSEAGFSNNTQYTKVGNLEFKTMIKDRVLEYMEKEGGALTAAILNEKIDRIQKELDVSYKMDAAYKAFSRDAYEEWNKNLSRIKEEMEERVEYVVNKWDQKDLTHSLSAVIIQYGTGNKVNFINLNPNTKTYYTLDGSDPMGDDGKISPNAFEFKGSEVVLTQDATIVVRAFTTNNWGPLTGDAFEFKTKPGMMLTGIHYNPSLDTESEFILLTNAGEEDLDVSGYKITEGIDFEFPQGTRVASDETIVLAKDLTMLPGFQDNEQFEWTGGKLSNGGELIKLENATGETIDEVEYDDVDPWNPLADGQGYYLKLISTDSDNSLGENWEAIKPIVNNPSQELERTDSKPVTRDSKPVVEEIAVQAYPIPFNEQLNIRFDNEDENIQITMYNFSGNVVLKKNLKKVYSLQPIVLNTGYLRSGIYFVNIQSNTAKKVIKVTKR
ncbi:non-specific serine/threonine protein kinase [Flavobacteriaceae bacterium UJ101]|nr:non-specific serine/threonine protein kinase [Flavobacteriaceae bacterium UJ101]